MRALETSAIWASRVVAAGVFIWAAVPKLLDPVAFAESIGNYHAFPYWSWNLIATTVPWLELLAAVALVVGIRRRGAAFTLAVLDTAFMALILSVIARDIDISCGCFGQQSEAAAQAESVGWHTFFRDLALMVPIVVGALATPAERERDRAAAESTTTDE